MLRFANDLKELTKKISQQTDANFRVFRYEGL